MKKLLVICGPTATGKTRVALYLAKLFDGELISADSRQVYTYMDIGTGKDIPSNFRFELSSVKYKGKRIGYYTNHQTKIWGLDIVDPNEEFSVASYLEITSKVLNDIYDREKLPILVGGTGLYINAVVDGIETANIKKDEKLREKLQKKSVEELYNILLQLNSERASNLNDSDKKNPRRLIRAIEIAQSSKSKVRKSTDYNTLFIGLDSGESNDLNSLIERRVDIRLSKGFEKEIENLKKMNFLDFIPKSTLGYKHWIEYLAGKASKENAIINWKTAEGQYAKRQMTWFKKDKRIQWFNIVDRNYEKTIEGLVKKWYKE